MDLGDLSLLALAGALFLFVVVVLGVVFDMRSKAIEILMWWVQTLFLFGAFVALLNAIVWALNGG